MRIFTPLSGGPPYTERFQVEANLCSAHKFPRDAAAAKMYFKVELETGALN